MGYGRGYRSRRTFRGYRYRAQGPSKYSALSALFGPMVGQIRTAFLHLEEDALDELLEDYAATHGKSAAIYAQKTYPKWKSGATKLSGQTMERLVALVPPYLSVEQRFELVSAVLKKHKPNIVTTSVRIDVEKPDVGFAELDRVLASMTHEATLAYLPERVLDAAKWLNDDDVTVSRAMLAEAERRENDLIRTSAAKEIALLRRTIESGQVKSASYSVSLPSGRLSVIAFKSSACFIAGVCFGQNSNEAAYLRNWRDTVLLQSAQGRKFILWYYRHGESISKAIVGSTLLRAGTRRLLKFFICTLKSIYRGDNRE
ncbi:MAG: hypothetical protein JWQ80_41 [Massilia sp.]|nr:hypothetical protein [Massilia sp.]